MEKNPSEIGFRQLRLGESPVAVEVNNSQVSLSAGDFSALTVHASTGVAMTGERVNLVVSPDAIKVAGILALNPYSFIPLAPTFILSPPDIGIKYLTKAIAEYISMLQGVTTQTAAITAAGSI